MTANPSGIMIVVDRPERLLPLLSGGYRLARAREEPVVLIAVSEAGPEPDWRFTNQVQTVELQLNEPPSSRLIWIVESEGRIYVASGYMSSFLGRLWKHWAVQADQGDRLAVIRIDGTRYERTLVRIEEGPVLDGVAAAMTAKYGAPTTRQDVEAGNTWIFQLAPRGS